MQTKISRKTPTQQRSKKKWESILEISKDLFAKNGFEAVSTNLIAKESGISIGTLYQFFDNKDQILYSLAEKYKIKFQKFIDSQDFLTTHSSLPLADIVSLFIDNLAQFHSQNKEFYEIFYSPFNSSTLAKASREFDAQLESKVTFFLSFYFPNTTQTLPYKAKVICGFLKVLFLEYKLFQTQKEKDLFLSEIKILCLNYLLSQSTKT